MSKWENHKTPSPSHKPLEVAEVTNQKDLEQERIRQWTIQIASAMIISGKNTVSAIPGAAYNLAKDLNSYLKSAFTLEDSQEEK